MRVSTLFDQLNFCVTRLEVDRVGHPTSPAVGTGFLVSYQWDEGKKGDFLVTARHVVEAGPVGHLYVHLGESGSPLLDKGYKLTVADWKTAWQFHPNPQVDVAVMPFGAAILKFRESKIDVFTRAVPPESLATEETLSKLDSVENVVFVGFPMGMYDSAHLLPITRRGSTATPPFVDYNNLPAFLIDASVFWGSSGSPVFIADQGAYGTPSGITIGARFHLLGIISQLFARVRSGAGTTRVEPVRIDDITGSADPIDLGLVFKTRTITETIECLLRRLGARGSPGSRS